ncbi:hypothetical protein [Halocatena halophila]
MIHDDPFFSVLVFVVVIVTFPDFEWMSSWQEYALILLLTAAVVRGLNDD